MSLSQRLVYRLLFGQRELNTFKENITHDELSEIVFKFSDGSEAKFSPCYESWQQYGDVLLDPDLLDRLMNVINEELITKESFGDEED